MYFYSYSERGFYSRAMHGESIPADAVPLEDGQYQYLLNGHLSGKQIAKGEDGQPILIEREKPQVSMEQMCALIDQAADRARSAVVVDPVRAFEYDRAASQAIAYAEAGYPEVVPPMVASYAIAGRTPRQAADSIIAEAKLYVAALEGIRAYRLQAKEEVRALMAAGNTETALLLANNSATAISGLISGVGNAPGDLPSQPTETEEPIDPVEEDQQSEEGSEQEG